MSPFVRRLVERLFDPKQPLSRNRHPATFETPEGVEALRVYRRLRSVRRDVLSAAKVQIDEGADEVIISLEWPAVRGRRSVRLSKGELAVLRALPDVREMLVTDRARSAQ
ncbi:MAG: hypothetical protein JNG84_05485 [Archangium sp.]|nr:hypothetical protein [Archangium sp.]